MKPRDLLERMPLFDSVRDDTKDMIVVILAILVGGTVMWFISRMGWARETVAFALGWTARWFVRG